MQLCAILTKADIVSFVDQIMPLRVAVRPRRVITLGRASKVELVAGQGLRVRGDAHFSWDAFGVTLPVTLGTWQVLLVPSFVVRDGTSILAFDPRLERLDFKRLPPLLGGPITEAVSNGLSAQKGKLAWDFEKHFSITRPLPPKISPAGELTLGPAGGNVEVTASELRITLDFALNVRREAAPASMREPLAALSATG